MVAFVFLPLLIGRIWMKVVYGDWNEEGPIETWLTGLGCIILGSLGLGGVFGAIYSGYQYIVNG